MSADNLNDKQFIKCMMAKQSLEENSQRVRETLNDDMWRAINRDALKVKFYDCERRLLQILMRKDQALELAKIRLRDSFYSAVAEVEKIEQGEIK